jgi:glycosyltransferase involved in cell wall biosynthesis
MAYQRTRRMMIDRDRPLDLLLYAAVPRQEMLGQGFYAAEAEGLRAHPRVRSVIATNRLSDVRRAPVHGIISYFYSHSAAVGAIARLRGIPVVATGGCEQLLHDPATPTHVYLARTAAFHACTVVMDRLLATSTSDFDRMREVAKVGRDRIQLSFHGVAAVEQVAAEYFNRRRDSASLVTIAGLDSELNVRRKGVLEAVDLLARFHSHDPSASLTIIGRNTCRAMVEARAAARGVAGHVHITGYVTEQEKLELLRRSRYYVQLSEYEGFGIGALEGLAQGCQVIHTNMGGLRDTIGNYGIVLQRDAIDQLDVTGIAPYAIGDWLAFTTHLAQFEIRKRADVILSSLNLKSKRNNK